MQDKSIDNMCFACGRDNPISLKLDFKPVEADLVEAKFTPTANHQGYDDIMHGGLVSTLLDEAMAKVIVFKGIKAVTAEISVKFKKPVLIGGELKIVGKLNKHYQNVFGTIYYTEAYLEDEKGHKLASAEAKFMEFKE